MSPPNLLTEWARLLIGSLARAGVTDAVISPGSRSTPFAWAALREPGLRCRTIVDERSAAFFAVGQAKIAGTPSLLICTSGSAAANYFPAIVEADRSGTPLLVLTADRPFELQASDAPQTIDQVKLYGDAVRRYFEIGMPDAGAGALDGLRRIAAHATMLAHGPMPGPVHLNARARKPLEPIAAEGDEARALASKVEALLEEAATFAPPPELHASSDGIDAIAHAALEARRGVIVCGPMSPAHAPSPRAVARLSRVTGFPVHAEATSQLRFDWPVDSDPGEHGDDPTVRVHALDALLRSAAFRERFRPDFVLRIGGALTSRAWNDLVERGADGDDRARTIREHVIAPHAWSDPHASAVTMLVGAPGPALERLADRIAELGGPAHDAAGWRAFLGDAEAAAREALDVATGTEAAALDEGVAVRVVVDALPEGALLAVGNSLPVREVDTFSAPDSRALVVWSQRGANGIDGLIAGAAGAAAASARPTLLLLGDVSALHDIGSLTVARECEQSLAIVVLDNGGGRIFEQLPLAGSDSVAEADWQTWLTPPRMDFEAAARAFGIGYACATHVDSLRDALGSSMDRPGATLVHVVVDGDRTIPAQREYWAEVDRRIRALD